MHFLGLAGIPRRYADYPDIFFYWNTVASRGSLLSLVSVTIFIWILWESLTSRRPILASIFNQRRVEALHPFPPLDHSYPSVPVLFVRF
jgi:heme/copper-type cytochrome/quinol oxidase subunit 1